MDVAAAVANLGISHSSHRSRAGWFRKVHSEHAHWGPSAPGSAVVEGLAIPVGCGRGGGGGAGREGRESRPPPEEEEAAEEALVVRIGTGGGGEEGEVGPVHRTTEKDTSIPAFSLICPLTGGWRNGAHSSSSNGRRQSRLLPQ